ncbi:hypothetical protein OF83DRAFT_1296220, partial [Amylostereum chailletii]
MARGAPAPFYDSDISTGDPCTTESDLAVMRVLRRLHNPHGKKNDKLHSVWRAMTRGRTTSSSSSATATTTLREMPRDLAGVGHDEAPSISPKNSDPNAYGWRGNLEARSDPNAYGKGSNRQPSPIQLPPKVAKSVLVSDPDAYRLAWVRPLLGLRRATTSLVLVCRLVNILLYKHMLASTSTELIASTDKSHEQPKRCFSRGCSATGSLQTSSALTTKGAGCSSYRACTSGDISRLCWYNGSIINLHILKYSRTIH